MIGSESKNELCVNDEYEQGYCEHVTEWYRSEEKNLVDLRRHEVRVNVMA